MKKLRTRLFLTAMLIGTAAGCAGSTDGRELPAYVVSPDKVFIAGISSGGFMAVQMDVAYSNVFKGAAIYAGGPDYCARGKVELVLTECLQNVPPIDVSSLVATTRAWSAQGLIDPVSSLKAQPVYLWSGLLDVVVRPPVMDALQRYYTELGADIFRYDKNFQAAHGWESPKGPLDCRTLATPYVVNCRQGSDQVNGVKVGSPGFGAPYDSVSVWLSKFLGHLNPKNTGTLTGKILPFDQDRFAPNNNAAAISMGSTGYAFVPGDCAAMKRCSLLLALHGCLQSHSAIGMTFIQTAGINEWADTNHTIVLYPQTVSTFVTGPNPEGCWNWWGYLNDPNYALKSGAQMEALYRMVAQLSSGSDQARKP